MKTIRHSNIKPRAITATLLLTLALPAVAQTTWSTSPSDTWWSTDTNWTPAIAPTTNATAILGNTNADRTIIYDSPANGALSSLTITQTTAFNNALELRRTLSLSNALTLSATNGGTSKLLINTAGLADPANRYAALTTGPILTATSDITIGTGGRLEFARLANTNTGNISYLSGNVTINGGTLATQRAVKTANGPSSFTYQIDSALTLNSGTLALSVTPDIPDGFSNMNDTRVKIGGNFIATGGSITVGNYGYGKNLYLAGATNVIGEAVTFGKIGIMLSENAAQSLTGGASFFRLEINGGDGGTVREKLIGVERVNELAIELNNVRTRLKLDQDLTVTDSFVAKNSGTSNRDDYIDTNGHTLDASAATFTLSGGYNADNGQGTAWHISGNGTLKISSINLATGQGTFIDGSTTVIASATGAANNLSGGNSSTTPGVISADSTFAYAATAGSSASTLESNRAIGHLRVDSGTLALIGDANIAATSVTVKTGATLDLTTRAFATSSLVLGITGTTIGHITGGSLNTAGITLTLNFGATPAIVGNYAFFDGTALSGTFDSIVLSGLYSGNSLNAANSWTATTDGLTFIFDTTTGALAISASQIPEPTTYSILAGFGILIIAILARRR